VSRTDELRRGGARERSGGGGDPFVKFGDEYSWVEGTVSGFWTGKYGDVATLTVGAASTGLEAVGKDEEGNEFRTRVEPGMLANVGLNNAALEGRVSENDKGKTLHFAFEGWGETRSGQRFRQFAVLELGADGLVADDEDPPDYQDDPPDDVYGDLGNGDDLPF
jgi:hypothetical protein